MKQTARLLIFIAAGVTCALAQEARFDMDPAKSSASFDLGDVLHSVHGTFKPKSGRADIDLSSGSATGTFTVDVTTGDTGNRLRDKKMHNDILESDKYPEATFTLKHVTGAIQDASTVQLQGTLRLHGADHDMTIAAPITLSGDTLTARLHFVIPYVDWGMKDPSNFVLRVSKKVEFEILAQGRYTVKR